MPEPEVHGLQEENGCQMEDRRDTHEHKLEALEGTETWASSRGLCPRGPGCSAEALCLEVIARLARDLEDPGRRSSCGAHCGPRAPRYRVGQQVRDSR